MKELKYFEILSALSTLREKQEGVQLKVRLLSNIIVHQLAEVLEYVLRKEGIPAIVTVGNYDNIVQDARSVEDEEVVILFWEAANLVDGLQYKADSLKESEFSDLLERISAEVNMVLDQLSRCKRVLINRFSPAPFDAYYQGRYATLCQVLNERLDTRMQANLERVDLRPLMSRLGKDKVFDVRNYYSSKALYRVEFFKEYAVEVFHRLAPLVGKVKKVLVMDCDNTLWYGILGEDGYEGIRMSGKEKEGIPFEAIQHRVVQLQQRGVIIAISSKNNPEDVDRVIGEHPDMVLREEHIVAKKVNWEDKATNIRALALELNLGLDSFVFVDDSDFEVNLVREQLPEVTVFQVPKKLFEYPAMMDEVTKWFYNPFRTGEDNTKTLQYREQAQREEAKSGFSNLEDYLRSLEIRIEVKHNDPDLIPRMAQMTQKTNQFNLTTQRYTEAEISRMVDAEGYDCYALGVRDKYGDSGITGLIIVKQENGTAQIDTFLMSCRIIGRNIEYKFADQVVRRVSQPEIRASYIPTTKNMQVSDLYDRLGFNRQEGVDGVVSYSINKTDYKEHKEIDYIKVE